MNKGNNTEEASGGTRRCVDILEGRKGVRKLGPTFLPSQYFNIGSNFWINDEITLVRR